MAMTAVSTLHLSGRSAGVGPSDTCSRRDDGLVLYKLMRGVTVHIGGMRCQVSVPRF